MTGGRVGFGVGVGVDSTSGAGAVSCVKRQRSSEIQRQTITPTISNTSTSTTRRNVLTRNVRTQFYFLIQAKTAVRMPITLRIDIIPAGIALPV